MRFGAVVIYSAYYTNFFTCAAEMIIFDEILNLHLV